MKKIFFVTLFIGLSVLLWMSWSNNTTPKTYRIAGQVITSQTNEALANVMIFVADTVINTDSAGRFAFDWPNALPTLTFSHITHEPYKRIIPNKKNHKQLVVRMKEKAELLNEGFSLELTFLEKIASGDHCPNAPKVVPNQPDGPAIVQDLAHFLGGTNCLNQRMATHLLPLLEKEPLQPFGTTMVLMEVDKMGKLTISSPEHQEIPARLAACLPPLAAALNADAQWSPSTQLGKPVRTLFYYRLVLY